MTSPPNLQKSPTHAPCSQAERAAFNPERYRCHLKDMALSQEEADAMLAMLWDMMTRFVELGWDVKAMPIPALIEQASTEDAPFSLKTVPD